MAMRYMHVAVLLLSAVVIMTGEGLCAGSGVSPAGADETVVALSPGTKYWIGDTHYFTCSFDKKPQLANAVLKIQIFTKEGNRDTSFQVTGEADMPSMRGAHYTGLQPFKLNKKGDYLLPLAIVMPGDWEVVVRFFRNDQVLFTGRLMFHV